MHGCSSSGAGTGIILHLAVEHASCGSVSTPFRKPHDLQDTNAAVEPDRQDIVDLDRMARRFFPNAVDADMSRRDQRGRTGAGLYHPRVPEPFIDTLTLQDPPMPQSRPVQAGPDSNMERARPRVLILAVGELLFERGELRKRRIGIDRVFAFPRRAAGIGPKRRANFMASVATALARPLETEMILVPVPSLGMIARRAPLAFASFAAARRFGSAFCRRTRGLAEILEAVAAIATMPLALRAIASLAFGGRLSLALWLALALVRPAMTVAIVARTALLGTAAGPPDLDHRRRWLRFSGGFRSLGRDRLGRDRDCNFGRSFPFGDSVILTDSRRRILPDRRSFRLRRRRERNVGKQRYRGSRAGDVGLRCVGSRCIFR